MKTAGHRSIGKGWLIGGYVILVVGSVLAGPWLAALVEFDLRPSNEPEVHRAVLLAIGLFVLTAALPFVPGAEIGLALMLMLGPGIAPLVYLAMVGALSLAYIVGRLVPVKVTAAFFGLVGLTKAREMMLRMASLDQEARLKLLIAAAPRRLFPFLLRHRVLLLALALNLPGNTLAGGGGGIALAAGLSGLYRNATFLTTMALAVLPVPLLFFLGGTVG